jgi:hypothetical protein
VMRAARRGQPGRQATWRCMSWHVQGVELGIERAAADTRAEMSHCCSRTRAVLW